MIALQSVWWAQLWGASRSAAIVPGRDFPSGNRAVGEALSKATSLVSGRRGQVLGYDSRPGWPGWDVLSAMIPEAEIGDLIVELRSATAGVGTFSTKFDHMAELNGKPADAVLQEYARTH